MSRIDGGSGLNASLMLAFVGPCFGQPALADFSEIDVTRRRRQQAFEGDSRRYQTDHGYTNPDSHISSLADHVPFRGERSSEVAIVPGLHGAADKVQLIPSLFALLRPNPAMPGGCNRKTKLGLKLA
jgi:hypothetical protein